MYRLKIDDEVQDARNLSERVAELSGRIDTMIAQLPAELPVSPVDAVIEGLQAHGVSSGEISGRNLAYRGGRIVRRPDTDRRAVVKAFNNGDLDVLLFNMAGATGGSYHAAPEFRDQRPRSLIEMETPIDIIKYVQSQGRGNRYGQVARPRVVSVMTGIIPEMRILQQRNRKLRSMGASIDGNRSHPLLLDDVPDFLNVVGDQATAQVLIAQPELARKLGFTEFVSLDESEPDHARLASSFDSGSSGKLISSIANRVLSRSLVLSASGQSDLVDLIRMEFEAIIEELESRNASPLKPKEISGEIEILTKTLFSGVETDDDDLDVSTFLAPLFMSTGIHHFTAKPINGDQLLTMINRSKVEDGVDGFASHADRLETMLPNLVAGLIAPGSRMETALAHPEEQSGRFRSRLSRLRQLIFLLRNIRPGRVLHIDSEEIGRDTLLRTIVKLSAPDMRYVDLPQAYKIRTVRPGDSEPEIVSLAYLGRLPNERIRFGTGQDRGINERHLREFEDQCNFERRYPVQILSGNHLSAITEARRHSLGTMSLFKERSGQMQRGVVVKKEKVDLNYLPVSIPSGRVAAALAEIYCEGGLDRGPTMWVGKRDSPQLNFRFMRIGRGRTPVMSVQSATSLRSNKIFENRPILKSMIPREGEFAHRVPWPERGDQITGALLETGDLGLNADGQLREKINEINRNLAQARN